MSPLPKFSIDFSEEFPTLDAAPSIEAVIHWQAKASKPLERQALQDELTQRLPDYPICQPQQDIQIAASGTSDGTSEVSHRTQWNGFRLQDEQGLHVAQFTPSGVIFSRLKPYEKWEAFKNEAIRFWELFLELAEPPTIKRLGVRYINQIPLAGKRPSAYLNIEPCPLPGIAPSSETFFYQDTYPVPDYPYRINWVRTIQPQQQTLVDQKALIVDIDVFTTTELLELNQESLNQRLREMRWLKNKVFFSSITQTALEQFGA
ncbi:MAG: TIGR04255 family protein [Leptolyngbyaceae cyanobacterium]